MNALTMLVITEVALTIVLLVVLSLYMKGSQSSDSRPQVKEDLKKIKDQIDS